MDLAMALAERAPRRPRRRQRPGRRPVRRRGPRARRLADAARRRGRRAARRAPAAPGQAGHLRQLDRLLVAARPIAAAHGQPYAETLTGFKWIGRVRGLAFGYEEALGYCVDPEHVRDKDGVSALRCSASWRPSRRPRGRTLIDLLDDLAAQHGLHATDQLSVRVTDPAQIGAAMSRLRDSAADVARRPRGRERRRPLTGLGRAAAHRRPALPARRRRPGDRPPERHRAEAQGLPRGRRARPPRRRRRRRPHLRRGSSGRHQGRRTSGARPLTTCPRVER